MIFFFGFTIVGAVVAGVIFYYHLRRGQFDEIEETKYQLFRDE